jgi:hypothetical protein
MQTTAVQDAPICSVVQRSRPASVNLQTGILFMPSGFVNK